MYWMVRKVVLDPFQSQKHNTPCTRQSRLSQEIPSKVFLFFPSLEWNRKQEEKTIQVLWPRNCTANVYKKLRTMIHREPLQRFKFISTHCAKVQIYEQGKIGLHFLYVVLIMQQNNMGKELKSCMDVLLRPSKHIC